MSTASHARTGLSLFIAVTLFAAGGFACASEPKPRPTSLDPASPFAAESPPFAMETMTPRPELAPSPVAAARTPAEKSEEPVPLPEPPASGAAHGHHAGVSASSTEKDKPGEGAKTGKQPAAVVYTCPMHPEVISDKPGRCPKCGMKLVPKEPAEGKK